VPTIETRVFRRVGLAGNFELLIGQVTFDVNTFIATKDMNDMINIQYKTGQFETGARDIFYMAIVTYLVP